MHCLHSGFWRSPLYRAAQFRVAVVVGVVGSGLALDSLGQRAAFALVALAVVATMASGGVTGDLSNDRC
jgi:hypothetical protein